MPDPHELRSVIAAAEQAAAAGDHVSAERHLREAARLQEAAFGPLHPDLANTLNNLGVVCELADRPAEAEDCYRRAHAIAKAVLEPDHPFVATSGQNLRDFCAARGIPVEPEVRLPVPEVLKPAPVGVAPPSPAPSRASSPSLVSARSGRWIGVVGAGTLVLATIVLARSWFNERERSEPSSGKAPQSEVTTNAPAPQRPSAVPTPAPSIDTAGTSGRAGVEEPRAATAPVSLPIVADAQLCRTVTDDWQCDPASRPVEQGPLVFYTRLRSATDTTIEHRWYHANRLHHIVELRVRANPSSGYRTFSRNTMNDGSAGEWRVEIRAQNGTLLHEDRFVVR